MTVNEQEDRGRRPGRLRYGVCPVCEQTRHLLKSGRMGRHGRLTSGGQLAQRECSGQGAVPVEVVAPPEGTAYLHRKASK